MHLPRALHRRSTALVATAVALLAAAVPAAYAAAILTDGGFEKPKAGDASQFFGIDQSLGACTPGTARLCWLVRPTALSGAGAGIDLVPSAVWQPEKGNQSVELNGGARSAVMTQSFTTGPGLRFKVSYWVGGNPAFQGPVHLRV